MGKRIVVLIDGTWNDLASDTNVIKTSALNPSKNFYIKPRSSDDIEQLTQYFTGVGFSGGPLMQLLGGAIGLGLKHIVGKAFDWLALNYTPGDEIFLIGFSRGSYAVRALAGLIGISGVPVRLAAAPPADSAKKSPEFEAAWANYRAKAAPSQPGPAMPTNHDVRCVAVWDTVGSYGVPSGFGLDSLAHYISSAVFGFKDTQFGRHVQCGLHAVAADERRRPFVPTFWTCPNDLPLPAQPIEQVWFAGVHCNIGGGYPGNGLSDFPLVWLISRIEELTGLEFDHDAIRADIKPDLDGAVENSAKGWLTSQWLPYYRQMFKPILHGILFNTIDPNERRINERVHWSLLAKRGRRCSINDAPAVYAPPNLPDGLNPDQKAAPSALEWSLLPIAVKQLLPADIPAPAGGQS